MTENVPAIDDVGESAPDDVVSTPTNPRDVAAAEIAARYNVAADAEVKADNESFFGAGANASPEAVANAEPVPDDVQDAAEQMVTIKVNGVEQQIPASKALEAGIRTLQKETAADKRLEEASRALREAEQYLAFAQQQQAPQDDSVLLTASDVQKVMEATLARQNASMMAQQRQEQVVRYISETYADVWNDPYLQQVAAAEDDRLIKAGDNRSVLERTADVMNNVRAWRDRLAGTAQQTQPVQSAQPVNQALDGATLDARRAMKAALPDVASTAASARMPAPAPEKRATASDIINAMRKARNQNIG